MAIKTSPGEVFRAVTPSDTDDLPLGACRGFIVGVAGDVEVIGSDDSTAVVLPAMAAGVVHPCSVRRILAGSTTATGIVAVY